MKQYKYKINGNLYNVTVNDPEENIVNVEVNGTPYKVELDKPVKATITPKPVTRPAAAPKTDNGAPVVQRPVGGTTGKKDGCKISTARSYSRHQGEGRRYREKRTNRNYP